jgi:hypothetical protein
MRWPMRTVPAYLSPQIQGVSVRLYLERTGPSFNISSTEKHFAARGEQVDILEVQFNPYSTSELDNRCLVGASGPFQSNRDTS